jgi:hypothetical protein
VRKPDAIEGSKKDLPAPTVDRGIMQPTEQKYKTDREYIFTAHPEMRWVFTIADMATKWPDYTEALGKAAQEEIVQVAVKYAKQKDALKGIDIRITP